MDKRTLLVGVVFAGLFVLLATIASGRRQGPASMVWMLAAGSMLLMTGLVARKSRR